MRNIGLSPPTGIYDSECYCSESEPESKDGMLLDVDAAADNESESSSSVAKIPIVSRKISAFVRNEATTDPARSKLSMAS